MHYLRDVTSGKFTDLKVLSCLQMAAGLSHCAVRTREGELLTWGWNSAGQLGLGASSSGSVVSSPQKGDDVPASEIKQIAAGRVHTIFCTGRMVRYSQV